VYIVHSYHYVVLMLFLVVIRQAAALVCRVRNK